MKKSLLVFLCLFAFNASFSQQLSYKSGGQVLQSGNKLSKESVQNLLAAQPALLASYQSGKKKQIWGDILVGGGIGFTVGSLAGAYVTDSGFPPLALLGVAAVIVGIPIRSGYTKKIKTAVDGYNEQLVHHSEFRNAKVSLCANAYGLGFQIAY